MQKPGEPDYILSWDEFPSAYDSKNGSYGGCADKAGDSWRRCFYKDIASVVDWINVMAYNQGKQVRYYVNLSEF